MRLGILGPVLVADDAGREIPVTAARQRTLLATLVARANRAVPADELVEIVWDGAPPGRASGTLRSYVQRLRRSVGPEVGARIVTRERGYLCRVAEDECDVLRFEALYRDGAAAVAARGWPRVQAVLTEALGLWRGTPLADVDAQLLRQECVPRLERVRAQALEWRIEADLHLGRYDALVPELRTLVEAYPLREHGHASLMVALYGCGRRAEALDAFHRARRVLVDELGVEPGPRLRELHRQILDGKAVSPPRQEAAVPRQLLPAVGHFTGRTGELATLAALIDPAGDGGQPAAVAAIVGTAGVGKTALAVHWAHQVADRFPDGQLYADLCGFDSGRPVAATEILAGFLAALGRSGSQIPADGAERAAVYRSLLAGRRMLIVLDNAQRAEQVRPLLPGAPGCVVLVTSRDTLAGLVARDGAARLRLDVLPREASIALLRKLVGARIDEDRAGAAALAQRCCGLPLALRVAAELVAARPAVPVATLAGELADLGNRLDVLDAGGDEATAVRAVFSWSYRHLEPAAARAFRVAALHPGTDLDPYALAVLLDTEPAGAARLLHRLARAHLVHPTGSERYGMHDLLRGYARERAAAEDPAADQEAAYARLRDWYLRTAAAAMDALFPAESGRRPGPAPRPGAPARFADPGTAQAWLEAERANLVASAVHADHQTPATGYPVVLAATVERYLLWAGHLPQARTLHSTALRAARRTGDRSAEATALSHLGFLEWAYGRCRQAAGYQRQALAQFLAAADRPGVCRTLHRLALAERKLGNLDAAAEHAETVLVLTTRAGDRLGQARALQNLALTRRAQGGYASAVELLHRVLALLDELGDWRTRSLAVKELGVIDLRFGRLAAAEERLTQAMELCRVAGNRSGETEALSQLGQLLLRRGRAGAAGEYQSRALTRFREIADRHGECEALARLALTELACGRTGGALDHLDEALTLARALHARPVETFVRNGFAETLLDAGRAGEAAGHASAALELAAATGDRDERARAHRALARIHASLGDAERAGRSYREAVAGYAALGVPEAEELTASERTGTVRAG